MTASTLFCFGLGFSARALTRRLQAQGWQVSGTARSEEKLAPLSAEGITSYRFDGEVRNPAIDDALAQASHVVVSIPPGEDGDPALNLYRKVLIGDGRPRWIGYLSTTGVYGNRDGGWVDERSETLPTGARSHRRLAAEQAWLALGEDAPALTVEVFRLAGIYGPGRNVLKTLRSGQGRRIDRPGQMFSRIHVEDIASVLEAAIEKPRKGAIYNVCDNEAAEPQAVTAFAADLLGMEPPALVSYEAAELSPMAASFWADNKRVRNNLIQEELGVTLRYPTYREGLRGLYEAGE